jgi:hypothetical protein
LQLLLQLLVLFPDLLKLVFDLFSALFGKGIELLEQCLFILQVSLRDLQFAFQVAVLCLELGQG